jgi:hypothetical protein
MKNVSGLLVNRLQLFERVRAIWQAGIGTWLAMDFEAWEREHTVVTEFGWASIHVQDGDDIREQGHLKLRYGNTVYYNGTYVPNHREVRRVTYAILLLT